MNPIKYRKFPVINLPDRTWPNRELTHAPQWCSVDLRDGNQALEVPMTVAQKLELFEALVTCGFKEIEVGFPASSPTEFQFVRHLIENDLIPDDVTIQVLVQVREDLIIRTVESLHGAKKVIIHLYSSTSPAQRRIVFGFDKPKVIAFAVEGTQWVKKYSEALTGTGTEVRFQYSPESFSATEVEFAREVCEAVMNEWQPTSENPMILNLPETVEVAMPNVYADQIEWFCRHMTRRTSAIISVHTHNDRGTGVASTELALLAGVDRVEGTLFGNGERTGNVDIVTVALNMLTQEIDPKLDFSQLDRLRLIYERCTSMTVPPRHPYAGELVFTAFSGTHQDAVAKGMKAMCDGPWDVPYLVIDPEDLGRTYENVIRINGQSGKRGVAHILEKIYGIDLPKDMLREFGPIAGKAIDQLGREATADDLKRMLWEEYIELTAPYRLIRFASEDGEEILCHARVLWDQNPHDIIGKGNGPISAFIHALRNKGIADVEVITQAEHSLGEGSEACAIAYIQLRFPDGTIRWGAGVDTNIARASINAVISGLNRK
jgi:2-isopropylmalate synthase